MGNAVRGYKGAADDSPTSSLFADAMSARFSAQQVVDLIFSDIQEEPENNDIKSNQMLLVTYTWLADVNASVAKCLCF